MRIGLFGGSFDPIHNGHIAIMKAALESGYLDILVVVPVARNSFKRGRIISAAPYRYYMAKDVADSIFAKKSVFISDIEFSIDGISYTVSTLEKFADADYLVPFLIENGIKRKKAEEPHKLYWICGSDILPTFDKWYKPEEIVTKAGLLVASRPGYDIDIEEEKLRLTRAFGFDVDLKPFALDGVEAASSAIRESRRTDDIPEAAAEFIKTHALYPENDPLDFVSDKACEDFYEAAIKMYPYLGQKRLLHTLNVGLLSAHYAHIHGADADKALIAGALHDCAKELDIDLQREMAFKRCGDLMTDKKLLHSPSGAVFAEEKFGIADDEILDAITYHTTGREGMTLLEKIVYLADKLEPSRNYTDLSEMRVIAETDLDRSLRLCVEAVRNKFKSQGRDIHPLTCGLMKDLGIIEE